MKQIKLIAAIAALISACFAGIIGCTTTQQTTAYNSIYTVEQSASTAVDGYYALVINGTVPTNSVPQVSKAFNDLQAACTLAAATSEAGTNALASAELNTELSDLLNLVAALKQ